MTRRAATVVVAAIFGCGGRVVVDPAGGALGGAGGASTATTSSVGPTSSGASTSSVGGAGGTATSTGGAGGTSTGGAGGTGTVQACSPGSALACYEGPPGTVGIGACKMGKRACLPDGSDYGPCLGQVTPAPVDVCWTPEDDDCDQAPCATSWSTGYVASVVSAPRVAVDPGGRAFVSADVSSIVIGAEMVTGPGLLSVLLAHNHEGQLLWYKKLPAGVHAIGAGPNGVVVSFDVTGTVTFDAVTLSCPNGVCPVLAVIAPNGTVTWANVHALAPPLLANATASYAELRVDAGGSIVARGFGIGKLDLGGGVVVDLGASGGAFLARFTPTGQPLWAKPAPLLGLGDIGCAAVDASGQIYLLGVGLGAQLVVSKIASDGTTLSVKGYGPFANSSTCAGRADAGFFLSGRTQGALDFGGGPLDTGANGLFFARLGPNGEHLFSAAYPAASGGTIASDGGGRMFITGPFWDPSDFGTGNPLFPTDAPDVLFAVLDAAGKPKIQTQFGEAGYQSSSGIDTDAQGAAYITGVSDWPVDFGQGPVYDAVSEGIFLAKIVP